MFRAVDFDDGEIGGQPPKLPPLSEATFQWRKLLVPLENDIGYRR